MTRTIVHENGIDLVDRYLSEDWVDIWAAEGVREVEDYLCKHAAFDSLLDGDE